MALPRLSDADRKKALQKALEVRKKRAQLRADLKSGKVKLASILRKADDPVVGRMKVSTLLESLPGLGKVRSRKVMEKIGISPSRRVQGLGSKQKEALLKELG
jgi:hypothetical protein